MATLKENKEEVINMKIIKDNEWLCNGSTKLALVIEIFDERDYADNPDPYYPYGFEVSIVNAEPCNPSDVRDAYDNSQDARIESSYYYRGGVPITHDLYILDADNKKLLDSLTIKDARMDTQRFQYGTLLAQGHKVFTFLKFSSEEVALKTAEVLLSAYSSVIFGLVGFYLDRPTNLAGEDGWKTILEAQEVTA